MPATQTRRPFPAKYASTCKSCRQPIEVGTLQFWIRGEGTWHEGCYEQGATASAPVAKAPTADQLAEVNGLLGAITAANPAADPYQPITAFADGTTYQAAQQAIEVGRTICREQGIETPRIYFERDPGNEAEARLAAIETADSPGGQPQPRPRRKSSPRRERAERPQTSAEARNHGLHGERAEAKMNPAPLSLTLTDCDGCGCVHRRDVACPW